MVGLVTFARFNYDACVDMVLSTLEREQASEDTRAGREGHS